MAHGGVESLVVVGTAGADRVLELGRRLADEMNRDDIRSDRRRKRGEALALQRAAEDQMDGLFGVRLEGPQSGGDVRRLRVLTNRTPPASPTGPGGARGGTC
jgi:hypothetical protein